MTRRASDDPRDNTVCVRLTGSEVKRLDEARGGKSRSDFVRSLLFGRLRKPK